MREKLILFGYEIKNALIGMVRHWVLCLSSILTIFLTLTLVAVFVLLELHVDRFSKNIAHGLQIHVVCNQEITEQGQIDALTQQIENTENVATVTFSSRDNELEQMISEKGDAFAIYRGDNNPLANAFYVKVEDETKIDQTSQALSQIEGVASSFYGGGTVNQLVQVLNTIQWVSFGFVLLLTLLSLYLIYSTIRATIHSRQDEISIMKTVGATPSFIRIPFEIEGILLGLVGALIPVLLIWFGYPNLYEALKGRLFIYSLSLMPVAQVRMMMSLILLGLGALAGWLASLFAASRFLSKIR